MAATDTLPSSRKLLKTPERNRYFPGKMLDVYHFELETGYLNAKRHLLNRLVSGYGVICGLDVRPGPDERHVIVTAGAAIDKWGREIIVPEDIKPLEIPGHLLPKGPGKGGGYRQDAYGQNEHRRDDEPDEAVVRLMLCYHECEADPTPVLGGDCGTADECAAGAIRERYRLVFKEGAAPPIHMECRVPDLFRGDRVDYEALVKHVSEGCPQPAADPCIPLANLRLGGNGHACDPERIDIAIRPIVYTNDLLFEIILSLLAEGRDDHNRRSK
jgi:hypothetical protein